MQLCRPDQLCGWTGLLEFLDTSLLGSWPHDLRVGCVRNDVHQNPINGAGRQCHDVNKYLAELSQTSVAIQISKLAQVQILEPERCTAYNGHRNPFCKDPAVLPPGRTRTQT